MCRGDVTRRSRKRVSSPNALAATRRAVARAAARSAGRSTACIPLPPPPAEGLISRGNPTAGAAAEFLIRHAGLGDARNHRNAVPGHMVLGADLVPHDIQGLDPGADEGDAGGVQRPGEVRVLAEESVAGVHRLGAGVLAGPDDRLDAEVALGGRGGADPDGGVGLAHVAGAGVGIAVDGN
jgi:hypothetical protein